MDSCRVSNDMGQQQIFVGSMLFHLLVKTMLEDKLNHPFHNYIATFHGTCRHFQFWKLFTKHIFPNLNLRERLPLCLFVLFITSSRFQDSFLPCTYNYQAHYLAKCYCAMVSTPVSSSTFW
jgi:hypothetical protein